MKSKDIFAGIIASNSERERKILSKHACKSREAQRKFPEKVKHGESIKPPFSDDVDRIIHSMVYSRYIDKTQVFYLFENDHITHRVLHVQLVSKIGRAVGRCLGLNEDLIEAIALGHDLGHVPFGHDGEKILNDLCMKHEIGFFCHSAQSVRFLQEIE